MAPPLRRRRRTAKTAAPNSGDATRKEEDLRGQDAVGSRPASILLEFMFPFFAPSYFSESVGANSAPYIIGGVFFPSAKEPRALPGIGSNERSGAGLELPAQ